jgi:hypothetical protein
VENVNQWWLPYSFIGSHSFALTCKLKALKLNLKKWNMKKWNKEVFDNVKKQKMFFFFMNSVILTLLQKILPYLM